MITEPGSLYHVSIRSEHGEHIEITSSTGDIVIPPKPWRKLLAAGKGGKLYYDVYVKEKSGQWNRFTTITNTIAKFEIDRYVVYRRIKSMYNRYRVAGVYQRDLENYKEWPVIRGLAVRKPWEGNVGGCANCHTFCNNRPDRMVMGIRDPVYGVSTLVKVDGQEPVKLDTKFGNTAWHPSGRVIVYSINKLQQFFHETRPEVREAIDLDSSIHYYLVDSQVIKTCPKLARKDWLETYPTWSPDGRYLYFCSAPIPQSKSRDSLPLEGYVKIRYDLMRISYNVDTDKWGKLETVLSADETQKSMLLPRISPNGRFLVFVMCEYGSFAYNQTSSDLYIMDMASAERTGRFTYTRLECNSDYSESWHSFASNSRWMIFSSKRWDGRLFTKSYIAYIDEQGRAYKPLLLPQRDPHFYDGLLQQFGFAELIVEPVDIREKDIVQAIHSPSRIDINLPVTTATPIIP